MSSQGDAQLQAMIERLHSVPEVIDAAMPDCVDAMRAHLQKTIAAGTDSYGKALKLTKEGDQPLQHAAKSLHVAVAGRTLFVRLTGVEAKHHLARVRGRVMRPLIPIREIPPAVVELMRKALTEHFQQQIGGAL